MIPTLRALGLRLTTALTQRKQGPRPLRRRKPLPHPTLDTALSRALKL